MENLTKLPPDINTCACGGESVPLLKIRNEQEYDQAIKRLNELIDKVGTNEQHPLYNLLDRLGTIIEGYETQHYSIPNCSGSEVLAYLIEEHELSLSDLPEIVTKSTIKAILNKKQSLKPNQIKQLAQRFKVTPEVFL